MATQSSEEKGKKAKPRSGIAKKKDLERYSLIAASNQAYVLRGTSCPQVYQLPVGLEEEDIPQVTTPPTGTEVLRLGLKLRPEKLVVGANFFLGPEARQVALPGSFFTHFSLEKGYLWSYLFKPTFILDKPKSFYIIAK